MVHRRARVHGDKDGVDQVGEDDGESSRRLVRRARAKRLEGVKARPEVGHASISAV